MKCLHLRFVQAGAKVYTPYSDSKIESAVFAPDAVDNQQCPAVFARYGRGRIGYVGDVNNEEGSCKFTMAMIGGSIRSEMLDRF